MKYRIIKYGAIYKIQSKTLFGWKDLYFHEYFEEDWYPTENAAEQGLEAYLSTKNISKPEIEVIKEIDG